jgi:hypothetical protein
VRPLFSYANKADNEIFLEVGELPDSDKKGDIWDTSLYGYLRCNYDSPEFGILEVDAYFINKTMIGCPLPTFTQAQTLMVDLTFDNGNTYTVSPLPLYIVDEPIVTALNNTLYYYTYTEQVYIRLEGTNLDQSGRVYVKVADTS